MRRRPPHFINLSKGDYDHLQNLVRDGRTQQRMARRARTLLAMSQPETVVQQLATQLEQAPNTVWSLCRRYEQVGVAAVLDAPRSGRPRVISPPRTGTDRAVGLL